MILSQIAEAVKFYLALTKTFKLEFYLKFSQPTLQKWDFLLIRFFNLFKNIKIDYITIYIVLFVSFQYFNINTIAYKNR